ncbi:glycoside hydrolase family 32 protein [Sporolactobacillus sp. THM7-7]|nr:glycoside hydrolase family 32 protein [Sporolactobacillus sp. THM7-7]
MERFIWEVVYLLKRRFRKRLYSWLVLSLIGLAALLVIGFFLNQPTDKKKSEVREKSTYRPVYHFTTPEKWMNDPQRPVYIDGKYHYYYLYNRDYPNGSGTEWRHATSKDLVHWKDEGVAIPKYTNPNGDIWSGSVVVDQQNTAGFGKNAVVAIVTQPSADSGQQEQYLWYSTDKGKTFRSYSSHPVMPNPGTKDFRDPKVVWDDQDHKWIMLLAEGTKIGFYESENLKDWRYTGGFLTNNIGLIECPDLYVMRADDGTDQWILGASANGKAEGKPNTYAYWVGSYNGETFIARHSEPQWLDYGFDWYAGITFQQEEGTRPLKERYAIAWMNNWDYPHNTPNKKDGFNGMDSIVRQISLKRQTDRSYSLVSQPIVGLDRLTRSTNRLHSIKVDGAKTLDIKGDAYQLDADISWTDARNVGFRLRESADKSRHIDAGIFTEGSYSYVNRGWTDQPDVSRRYVESRAPFDTGKTNVHLKILVDRTSIEVFVDDGRIAYSSEVFPRLDDKGITLFSEGGPSNFKNIEIRHFRSIHEK